MADHQLFSFLITGALILAWVVWKNRPRKIPPYTSGDAQVVSHLQEMGSDMSKPHLIEFFFYFPTEEGANSVAEALTNDGFTIQSKEATSEAQWALVLTKRLIPDAEELEKLREEFELLVEPVQGEYDGFGAGIEA